MLHTEGRRGTHVSFLAQRAMPSMWRLQVGGAGTLDLSSGSPDPELLPEVQLEPDEMAALFRRSTYYGPVVEPELEHAVRAHWGDAYRPERVTIVDGSLDAMDRLTSMLLAPGDVVAMEEPTYPPLWQLLHRMRCVVRATDIDEFGPRPARVHLATAAKPRVFVFQPRAQNPTGASITPERLAELARLLARIPDTTIIEIDSVGTVAQAPLLSLAEFFPDRVVRVHGFSKSHGPDLRLAAVGGPAAIIERLEARRILGPGWSSRALQHVLTHLLEAPAAQQSLAHARDVYASRSRAFTSAIRARGIAVTDADGLNVWVPVADSSATAVALAHEGIAVAIGAPFQITPGLHEHCRVTVAALPEEMADRVAELIAAAQTESTRRIVN
jgi:DNA-binding transcriptional MocR family regulator